MTDPDPDAGHEPVEQIESRETTSTDSETNDPRTSMPDQRPTPEPTDSTSTDRADADPETLFEDDVDGRDSAVEDDGGVLPATEDDTITKLYWAGLAGAVAFGAFALLRFYASVSTAIDVWVAAEYRPLLQASFNLVVVFGAGLVASVLLRRLSGSRS